MYLLDTNILSVGAPGPREAPSALIDWMDANSDQLFISTITVAEICGGITKMERTGAKAKARKISDWLELVLHLYEDRVLPFDIEAAQTAGKFLDMARAMGHSPGFADLAIASIASSRSLTLLTRNVKDFAPLRLDVVNPFEELPAQL